MNTIDKKEINALEIIKATDFKHVAIIMDGNRRWAKEKHLPSMLGHKEGVSALKKTLRAADALGIKFVTVYAFSTENWNRPKAEVDALMTLLIDAIESETPTLMKNNIRLLTIGDTARLPEKAREKFERCIAQTAGNTGLSLVLALSYSSRWEITEAVRKAVESGVAPEDITENYVSSLMTTGGMPDPDLLIRTSGELRISNFLLWQLAYAELYFTDVCWPAFTKEELYKAILDYQQRERRFGKTSEQVEGSKVIG